MAELTDQQREINRARNLRKNRSAFARELAKDQVVRALNVALADAAPDALEPDLDHIYRAELRRQRERIGGSAFAHYVRRLEDAG
jgi:hypothetical protein